MLRSDAPAATLSRRRPRPLPARHPDRLAGPLIRIAAGIGLALIAGISEGQGFPDEPTVHELAARDDVAGLARAINAGVPVDVRDADGRTALHVAAKEAHLFAAMMLVSKGADPNTRDGRQRTPLHLAADGDPKREGERFQVVKLLVAKGADRKARDADGKRPVDYATVKEFKDVLAP